MDILLAIAKEYQEWANALAAALPEARVHPASADAPACDYAVLWNPPPGIFAAQPKLKALFSLGAGVNTLLDNPELPRHLPLIRTEDSGMAAQMIEYALYCALREFRRFGEYADHQAKKIWQQNALRQRAEFSIGVLGLGVLGAQVASALAGFGFPVAGWSRSEKQLSGIRCYHGEDGLQQILARSRQLIILLPLTAETTGLINAERLARLPKNASLVNIARGNIIDDKALLHALSSGHLGHAYLDVFATEPLPADHPYWTHPKVSITPHIAALTPYADAALQVAGKIRALENGESVTGVVDWRRGY